ncbi:hypothetical protein Drose_15795 [Dactylosporangium roseum]|uniref:Uncharacterized protein n=1 Tax=Dactylosporangium roseum TaxID=47989 RepID=A0ABY5ZBR9_9ACTN|nr:hypothetical protein [Dactylosporangium roseum]UWZ39561.1 hypothetical protein Drose_15795 [Dactylosporangium roseum]
MTVSLEFVIPTSEGIFMIRDISADTSAQLPAWRASRIPGHRGGRLYGAAGAVLLVHCAHQRSMPLLRLELLDTEPGPGEAPWHWEVRSSLQLPTGRIRVDSGDNILPEDLLDIDAGSGPGAYGITFGHTGRTDMLAGALRVSQQTQHADVDTAIAGWRDLDGIEKYLVRLWPNTAVPQ